MQDIQLEKYKPITRRSIANLIAVENYGVLMLGQELGELVANKHPLTDRHLEIIQRETIKYRGFDPLAEANREKFELWKGTPTFDLAKEWAEIRTSPEWRW